MTKNAPRDPYMLVKSEVEEALQSATSLYDSYKRIHATLPPAAHAGSDELRWSRDELNATLTALEADLHELESSVDIVARDPRFGVPQSEVEHRQAFITRVRDEIDTMHRYVISTSSDKKSKGTSASQQAQRARQEGYPPSTASQSTTSFHDDDVNVNDDAEDADESDLNRLYARQQQSFLVESQDKMLDGIASTVSTLKNQAGVMGREIFEQVGMLGDLENQVDGSQNRLDRASRKLQYFIEKNKNSASSWTILLLIIVLSFLLLLIALL